MGKPFRFALAALGIASLTFLSACGNWKAAINQSTNSAPLDIPDVVIRQFHTDYLVVNVRRWELTAGLAELYQREDRFFLSNIHLDNFNDSGTVVSRVASTYGTIYNRTKNITLSNEVLLASSNGTTCTGHLFFWDNATEQFTSPGFVTVIKPNGDRLSGTGFTADRRLDTYVFLHAEGVLQRSDGKL